jgi:hypothetical protein
MRRKNDQLWKGILEEVFDDLLRFVFPEADRVFDMRRKFEYLDKELSELAPEPDTKSNTRFVDKLVKVYRQDGREEWLLVHVEVQGDAKDRALFPERMFRYYYRIFDRYRKPMTAIAIFTAQSGSKMPNRYEYCFLGTHHMYQYNTLCITDPTDEELENSNNPFAVVMLAARAALLAGKIPEKELLEQKLLVAKLLLAKKQYSRRKIKMILAFLRNYIVFEKKETNRIFDQRVDELTHQKNTMGILEQIAEMRAEEARIETSEKKNRLFVENLLKDATFSMQKIASLASVSVYFVKKVKASLQAK